MVLAQSTKDHISDTSFITMQDYAKDFVYDMKYASPDNFLKSTIYDCDQCLLRKEVADALIEANAAFTEMGLGIKFYDCYRPLSVQKQMWEVFPNPRYVANPYKSGSMHNRGGAVDITLVDSLGNELDMGTPFDYFGKEAHHDYTELPEHILTNRKLLKSTMETYSFRAIRTEWWHYSFRNARQYPLSNEQPNCD